MARRNKNLTTVKVGRSGGNVEKYSLPGDEPTVGDALDEAGISTSKGDRIRMDGEVVDRDTIVEEGAIITVQAKVAGATK